MIDASDVIIEVLDARDPLGCRCPQLEEAVLKRVGNKKLLFLLNKIGNNLRDKSLMSIICRCSVIFIQKVIKLNYKINFPNPADLVPKENVEKWLQCLQLEFPAVAFKASTQLQDKTVVWTMYMQCLRF